MTGMPWYAHSIESYERKTAHLSMLQHGAYRLMMDHYYKLASPLPSKLEQVQRICRAVADEEQAAVLEVLTQFFDLRADGWHNDKADRELKKMADISEKRRNSAKNSHASRAKDAASLGAKAMQTESKRGANAPASADTLNIEHSYTSSLRSEVSSEPEGSPPPRIEFIRIPTNRFSKSGEEAPIFEDQVVEFEGLFPAVDVRQALRAMRSWSITNTDKRKTRNGMMKFVNRWLSKQQDEGNGQGSGRRSEGKKETGHDKFFAAGASLINDFLETGSAEGGNDCDVAVEIGRPLLSS